MPAGTLFTDVSLALIDGSPQGRFYWHRQVKPAPHLHAKTSEFLAPSEIYGSQYFKQYFMVECAFKLLGLDLTVYALGRISPLLFDAYRLYEDVEVI